MRKIFIIPFFFLLFSVAEVTAQTPVASLSSGKELNVLYRNEATGGIFLHSRGFGLNYRRGIHVTGSRKKVLEIEALTMRDPKEIKIARSENAKGYYYGKLNSLIILRSGVGFQNVMFRRGERKSVEIRYSTFLGASLCFAKPVFLEITHNVNNSEPQPVSTEQYDPEKHNQDNIAGRAPFFTGTNKTKIYPGGYAKFALSCEYADNSDEIKALELGTVLDLYPANVPIMANKQNKPFFLTVYASFIFGKKWF